MKKLIIDTDPGINAAMAIIFALAAPLLSTKESASSLMDGELYR